MVQYKKILIPVDFSEHSELAAKQGISLAAMYGAAVHFLHVGDDAQKSATRLSKFIQHKIGFTLSVPVKKFVAQGTPASVILSVAQKVNTDAIIMGTRGMSGLRQLVQGSVAEKVLRHSQSPVIIIKKQKQADSAEYMFPQIRNTDDVFQVDKILVPLDFSPASKQAFHHAVSLASRYSSTIYTLTVFDRKIKEYGDDREEHTTVVVRGEKFRLWEEFPALFREADYSPSIRLKRMLLSGDPFSKIESIVEKKEIDVILMGTNGHSSLEHLLLGSVAQKVIRSLDCSVLTVRAHENKRRT